MLLERGAEGGAGPGAASPGLWVHVGAAHALFLQPGGVDGHRHAIATTPVGGSELPLIKVNN